MCGLNLSQFKYRIVQPVVMAIGQGGDAAVNLLTGTALAESSLCYLAQIQGPALGLFQMEPATHDDCWTNWLRYQPDIARRILLLCGLTGSPDADVMVWNMFYACAMARVKYLRSSAALPPASNASALSLYHKQYYNTSIGAADPMQNVLLFQKAIDA
ncbi:hypothetical protein [Acetobacter okinawensis]|uniref:hypothetical protein n=1 Tax=Acetobacter okinawensis TaxID=1076594 RepID=UPI00209CEB1A|nr:hypothetical protein [Acetobacter okinawensis]MCP1214150.1 hypothetical protein [Acetobacter okinawensis]